MKVDCILRAYFRADSSIKVRQSTVSDLFLINSRRKQIVSRNQVQVSTQLKGPEEDVSFVCARINYIYIYIYIYICVCVCVCVSVCVCARVEVWSKNDVRLAVDSGEKKFHHKAPESFKVECGEFLRFLAVKNFFHRIHRISYKKETAVHVFEPLPYCRATTSYSTAPFVTHATYISCEFKISVEINAANVSKI